MDNAEIFDSFQEYNEDFETVEAFAMILRVHFVLIGEHHWNFKKRIHLLYT